MSNGRYSHPVSLNEQEEKRLKEVVKKCKCSIMDVFRAGITAKENEQKEKRQA